MPPAEVGVGPRVPRQVFWERDLVSGYALQHQSRDVDDEVDAEVQRHVPQLLPYEVVGVGPLVQPLVVHFWRFGLIVVLVVLRDVVVDELVMEVVVVGFLAERGVVQVGRVLYGLWWRVPGVRRVAWEFGVVGVTRGVVVGGEMSFLLVGIRRLETVILSVNSDYLTPRRRAFANFNAYRESLVPSKHGIGPCSLHWR